ncbi:MAG: hypothetical protein ACYC5M_08225 [Anaerolineae bacterium]
MSDRDRVLRALWRDRMHVEPRALELSPARIRDRYAHLLAPADRLLDLLEPFPTGLLAFWLSCEAGHVVFTHRPSHYEHGPQPWRDGTLSAVCYVSVTDLQDDQDAALRCLIHLLDHLMGSRGVEEGGLCFSEGGGVTARLTEAARRFQQLEKLGYGRDAVEAPTAAAYLADTLLLYLRDPQRLNVLDPLAFKLYRTTILSEDFWS